MQNIFLMDGLEKLSTIKKFDPHFKEFKNETSILIFWF